MGELEETGRLGATLRKSLGNGRSELTVEERADLRAQLTDLLRVAPAAAVFVVLELFPVPGTGVLTPWVLLKLGLLPSRWREAHILARLRTEARQLRQDAHPARAREVEALVEQIEAGCRDREQAAHEAALLTQWDLNGNGRWDPDERAAYALALRALRAQAERRGAERAWMLRHAAYVFGPYRLSQVAELESDVPLMVCLGGVSPWVDLTHLQASIRATAPNEPSPVPDPADR